MKLWATRLRAATGCSEAAAALYVEPLNITMQRYRINTPRRQAEFLAQIAHESARLSAVVENLSYSAQGLAKTWPGRFRLPDGTPNALARALHRNPQAIASSVYANRMGNGAAASGDGWRFRGRGLIQVTGRDNYRRCGDALGIDLLAAPEALESPLYAALSAGWYWDLHQLNALADVRSTEAITRRINGGLNGLADRLALRDRAWRALA